MRPFLNLALAGAIALPGMSAAQDTALAADVAFQQCLTLPDALQLSSTRNPSVLVALAQEDDAEASVLQARSLSRPAVSAFGRSGLGDAGAVDNSISNQVGVRVSQRLIDFGDAKLARREASANRDAAGEDVNQARLDAALGTALAWLDHSEAKAQIERTQDRERFFQEQLDAVDAALEQGGATRTERATVASQLADAEGFGLELTFRRDRAATELRIDTQSQTVPCTDPQSVSRMALRVPTAELAAARALSNNPRLQALRDRAEASESASKRQKRARLPVISVVATGSYASFNRFENFEFRDRVGVDVSVPLYSGGALRAQSRQGEARASVARNQLLDAERRIEENARIARQRIESLQRRLRARTEFEYQTRLQFEAAEIERTAGTQTLRELVEIRLEYETASLQRIRTQYDIYREQLALLALSGDLLG